MGLLALSKERFRLSRLRKSLEREPLPHGIAECALGYLSLGDIVAARDVFAFGSSMFPDSDELRRVQSKLTLSSVEARVRVAKDRVKATPSAQAYLELADAYREQQRDDACIAMLEETVRLFGEHCTALTQLGEARFLRYRSSCKASDALATRDFLERAAAVDADALKPRYLLGELFTLVGAFALARTMLEATLRLAPEHDRARRLMREIERANASTDAATATPATTTTTPDLTFETLVAHIESARSFGDSRLPGDADDRSCVVPIMAPGAELARLRAATGAACAVFGSHSRANIAATDLVSDCAESHNGRADIVRDLADLCERAARAMDLGAPARLVVEGDSGICIVEMKRGAFLGTVVGPESDVDGSAVAVRDALERVVRA